MEENHDIRPAGPHGGCESAPYQVATLILDATLGFCQRFCERDSIAAVRMAQAARNGRQGIVDGSKAVAASKWMSLTLLGRAQASLEELLLDFHEFLRQAGLPLWRLEHPQAQRVRDLAAAGCWSELAGAAASSPEPAANTLICLTLQASALLDQQLRRLEREFLDEGDFDATFSPAG